MQLSFDDSERQGKSRRTRRENFLEEMKQVLPSKELLALSANLDGDFVHEPYHRIITLVHPAAGLLPANPAGSDMSALVQSASQYPALHAAFAETRRRARVDGATCYLFAGCGVVADSDPDSEYRETCLKLAPMRAALSIGAAP